MPQLTQKDIDILIEALDAWESKDLGGEILISLLSAAFTKNDPESQEQEKIEAEKRREKLFAEKRERKEISLLLKAKLVGIRQDIVVKEANSIIRS